MLDAVPCSSSDTCYAITTPIALHNTNGLLTKSGGLWRDGSGLYLAEHSKNFFAELVDLNWNSTKGVYWDRGNGNKNWSSANAFCLSKGWRLPLNTEGGLTAVPSVIYDQYSWTSTAYPDAGQYYSWRDSNMFHVGKLASDSLGVRCVR